MILPAMRWVTKTHDPSASGLVPLPHFRTHCPAVPLAMTCGLLAGQKQRLWRVSSARRRCWATSARTSRAPDTLRMLCWPSSANDRLTSSLNHRPSRPPPPPPPPPPAEVLAPAALCTGTDGKACRKWFCRRQETRSERVHSLMGFKWDCEIFQFTQLKRKAGNWLSKRCPSCENSPSLFNVEPTNPFVTSQRDETSLKTPHPASFQPLNCLLCCCCPIS